MAHKPSSGLPVVSPGLTGYCRPMHSTHTAYRLGSSIGLIGGAVFVWVNQAALTAAASWSAILAWAALFALAIWNVWIRPKPLNNLRAPRPRAGLIYGLACLGMVLLIVLGSRVLTSSRHEAATPALVALAVGLHFLPFSHAFNAPFFLRLGGAMAVLGAIGLILALAVGAPWGAGFAVLAGLAMTALVAFGARWNQGQLTRRGA